MTVNEIGSPNLWELVRPRTGELTSARCTERGYSSDLTALIEGEKGAFFVKAMRKTSRGRHYSTIREREINPFVQPLSPALRWNAEDDEWIALGFEVFEGRRADFGPESADLPVVVDLVRQLGTLKLPEIAHGWAERRWDRFLSEEDAALLRGDALLHTDINPSNFMIGASAARLVDWAWPTRGAGFIDPATLVLQLASGDHTPAQAESWAAECPAWSEADPRGIDAFVRATVRMQRQFAAEKPDESWLKDMVAAAESWAAHRGVLPMLDEE
jgi:hypothetical protein